MRRSELFIFYFSIGLTVISNVLYHIAQKVTPTNVNPMLALAVTYATATIVCLALLPLFPLTESLADSLRQRNWASIALGITVVGLELGFLLAYRAGWNIGLGALVSNVAVTLLLLPIGLLFFKEQLTPTNVLGIAVSAIGLWLVNHR